MLFGDKLLSNVVRILLMQRENNKNWKINYHVYNAKAETNFYERSENLGALTILCAQVKFSKYFLNAPLETLYYGKTFFI